MVGYPRIPEGARSCESSQKVGRAQGLRADRSGIRLLHASVLQAAAGPVKLGRLTSKGKGEEKTLRGVASSPAKRQSAALTVG